eukprot:3588685-Rhodomonas_salina.1
MPSFSTDHVLSQYQPYPLSVHTTLSCTRPLSLSTTTTHVLLYPSPLSQYQPCALSVRAIPYFSTNSSVGPNSSVACAISVPCVFQYQSSLDAYPRNRLVVYLDRVGADVEDETRCSGHPNTD